MSDKIVVGIGNSLCGDEGIGPVLTEALPERYDCTDVAVIDLGTAIFSLWHLLAKKKKAVILDCALMGEEPGAIKRFTVDQVRSMKSLRHFSLHEGDVLEVIQAAGCGVEALPEIVFFGIEPEQMKGGRWLSPRLEQKIPEYLALIAAELGLETRSASRNEPLRGEFPAASSETVRTDA